MKKEGFAGDLRSAIDVALLKEKAMQHVAGDKSKTITALLIIAIGALLAGIGNKYFLGASLFGWGALLSGVLFQVIAAILGIYVISVIAKGLFKGHAKHDEFFRALGFGYIVMWLGLVPVLGIVSAIWGLVILFSVLKMVHKLSTGNTIVTIILAIVAMVLVGKILTPTLGYVGIKGYGGSMDFGAGKYMDGNFNMNFKSDEGTSSMKMENGKMTIEGPGGETMEIEVPDYSK